MFNKSSFCHIASNNRNDQKGSVFIYKTTDTLAQVTQSGYFNEKLIDINVHDLIIHVQYDQVARTLKKSVLIVTERTLDNVETTPILDQTIGEDIDQLGDQVASIEEKIPGAASAANQLADKAFVNDIKTAIETTIAGINTSISTLNNDLSQTNQDLAQTNQNLAQTNQNLEQTNQNLEQTNQNLAQTNQNLAQTNQDLAQASGLITELSNGKADRNLLNTTDNVDIVIESQLPTADNGYTWYRKYKSGWVEQGGIKLQNTASKQDLSLPIEMNGPTYSVLTSVMDDNLSDYVFCVKVTDKTTTGFKTTVWGSYQQGISTSGENFVWQVSGVSAQ